ncbi:MAG: DUF1176 domain-containing protein [Sphingorhabdus sp.]
MSLFPVKAAIAGSLLMLPVHAAPIELGEQFFFKDWAAACDNGYACEAVSLMPENGSERMPSIMIRRESGLNDRIVVKLSLVEPKGDRYRILIDGVPVESGMLTKGEYPIQVENKGALKLARAIGRGRKLVVMGEGSQVLGELMLNGSAAALAHIDNVQNRARTRHALFAVGRKNLRPKSAPLPVISARRIGKQETIPDTTAIVGLIETSKCAEARIGVTEDAAYSLGRTDGVYRALVMISCGTGAYNMSAAPFIGTSSDGRQWAFAPARFDYPEKPDEGMGGANLLVNYSWDAENQQLSSYSKGRGLGDCGSAETYVWDGTGFRLTLAYAMGECRGSTEWMTLWRAKVAFAN